MHCLRTRTGGRFGDAESPYRWVGFMCSRHGRNGRGYRSWVWWPHFHEEAGPGSASRQVEVGGAGGATVVEWYDGATDADVRRALSLPASELPAAWKDLFDQALTAGQARLREE